MASPVREIVTLLALGSLEDGPLHTYELKKRMQACVGHFYKVSDGTLYPLLHSLEERGFVASDAAPGEAGHPDRVVYSITPAGSSEFHRLVNSPLPKGCSDVHFYARLVFLGELEPEARADLLAQRRERIAYEAEAITGHAERFTSSPGHTALLDLRQRQLAAELDWLHALESERDKDKNAKRNRRNR